MKSRSCKLQRAKRGTVTACWFIKYPQTVTLTSGNPPSDLAARATGILDSVYITDGDTVIEGQLIALVASTAHYEDVICAEEAAKRGTKRGVSLGAFSFSRISFSLGIGAEKA